MIVNINIPVSTRFLRWYRFSYHCTKVVRAFPLHNEVRSEESFYAHERRFIPLETPDRNGSEIESATFSTLWPSTMISCESEVSSPLDSSSSVDIEVSSPLEEFTFAILNLIAMISLRVIVVSLAITACYVCLVSFPIISRFRIEENE